MTSSESEVKALLGSWSANIRLKDIDQLMALYAPDIVYFDVVPPLAYVGSDAVRRNFLRWFDTWQSAIGVEIRDLTIHMNGDVAVACMLHGTSGTLKDGREVAYWLRATVACVRTDRRWRIAHEHVSLPVDFTSGRAAMDPFPEKVVGSI
jgi:ketosteroid isomerase-like protein